MTDVAAAVVVVGLFWALPTASAPGRPVLVAGTFLAAGVAGCVLLRHRWPLPTTVTAGVVTLVGTALGVCRDPMLATAWCLYPLAIERARRTRLVAGGLAGLFAFLALTAGVPQGAGRALGQQLVVAVGALGVAGLLGTAVGRQLASAREAERARVQLAVARDVHDVVGHALGVIVAESGVVLVLPDAEEQELRETLTSVEGHARAALVEVQGLVRDLRDAEGGLRRGRTDLESLVAATRAAGVRVEAMVEPGDRLGEEARAVLFRIVQESLGNVIRHAPGATCEVEVHEEGDSVVACIANGVPSGVRPRTPALTGTGSGLAGMRERASAVGGRVSWAERPDGGFEVRASLPVRSGR